ncbi:VCBS domain-containing protein, partial [Qipengyuania sp. 1NDH17]
VLDLGGNVRFADDGPTIDAAVVDGDVITLTTQDAETEGAASDTDVSTANFGGAFSVASSDYGADGAGSTAWAYSLVIDNATSGLTSGGNPITLSMNGSEVEGFANGVLVFSVSVDASTGEVTLTQYEAIDHDLPGDSSDYDSQLAVLADGVLSLSGTATITDGDGDTAEETVVLDLGGNIRFADDGPIAVADTNTMTEDTASVVGNVVTTNADDFGADGAGSPAVTAISGFGGAGTVGGSTFGEFGILYLNDDGTYSYVLNNGAVQYLDDGDSETDTFTYTIVDSDGDTSTTTLTITITGSNDAPTVGADIVAVSDEGLAGGNPDSVGTPGDTTNSVSATGQVVIGDADGVDDIEAVTLGIPSGDLSSGGETVLWVLQDDGQTLLGYTGDINGVEGVDYTPVVRVTIDNAGNFEVTQLAQIDHTYGDDVEGTTSITIPVSADDGTTVTTNANSLSVVFEDDSPTIGTFSPDTTTVANVANATATGTFTYSPGGDGHGEFIITAPAIDGITYQPVTQTMVDLTDDGIDNPVMGAVLVGTATEGGQAIFQFAVDVDGNYEFELLEPELSTSEDLSFSQLAAGGPGFRELNDDENTPVNENGRVEFTSNGTGVNANNNNFGVSNSFLDAGEWFEAEFHNPGTDGDDPALTDAEFLSAVDINVNTLKNAGGPNAGGDSTGPNVTINWIAYNDADGTQESGTVTVTSTGAIHIDPSIEFNRIYIENVDELGVSDDGGRIQIAGFTIYKTILPQDQEFNFTVSALDSDGDETGTVADLSVTLDADLVSTMEAPGKLAEAATLDLAVNDNEVFASSLTNQTTSAPRFDMRGMEMATVAAMASGFFMPEVMTDLSQTFGNTVSAGGHMVNFEFAGGLDMAAVQLPEAYATSFEGFVETAPAMLEGPMMANILEGSAFDMPQFEAVAGIETGGVDFMADMAATSNFAGGPSVFEGFAGSGEAANAMEALLMLQAPAQLAEAAAFEPGKALGEAVADLAAEAQVDAIVDHFAIGDGPAMMSSPAEGLLDSMIGNDMALTAMGMMTQDNNDEAAALAAATA